MLKAVIFDFDGVIVDTEPSHLLMFQRVLQTHGIEISEADYYNIYLAMDDWTFFKEAFRRHGKELEDAQLEKLASEKAAAFVDHIAGGVEAKPGAVSLVKQLSGNLPLAIASMALRGEIIMILKGIGIKDDFKIIVSAEDVLRPKPDPEVFLCALDELNSVEGQERVNPSQCLIIEDSPAGIEAGKRAGMKCLGIIGSKSREALKGADLIIEGLDQVKMEDMVNLFKGVK